MTTICQKWSINILRPMIFFSAYKGSVSCALLCQNRISVFCRCCVMVLVPPTAKVIRRRDLGLKSHPKDWRSREQTQDPWFTKQVA